MKNFVTALFLFLPVCAFSFANGDIVDSKPHKFIEYESLDNFFRIVVSKEEYEEMKNTTSFELLQIKYKSGDLTVGGFICRPKTADSKTPVIIYNRPGVGEGARIGNTNFIPAYEMYLFAKRGYVVVASNFRGFDGTAKDEVGGADVEDVMNLVPLIKNLDYCDHQKMYIVGCSRGGTMALQALKKGLTVKAAAVVGAVTDWNIQLKEDDRLGRENWPNFETEKTNHIESRSAIYWYDKINAPLLILHGGNDKAVKTQQSLNLALKLQEANKPYQLMIVHKGDHILATHQPEKIDMVVKWFEMNK